MPTRPNPEIVPPTFDDLLPFLVLAGDCWIWNGELNSTGYGTIRRYSRGRQKVFMAHRISLEHYKGPIPAGMHALHTCDIPCCFNPFHLYAGTQRQNVEDMYRRSRALIGMQRWNCKLTEDTVKAIRREAPTMTIVALARKYGLCRSNVGNIISGRRWKHVTEEPQIIGPKNRSRRVRGGTQEAQKGNL